MDNLIVVLIVVISIGSIFLAIKLKRKKDQKLEVEEPNKYIAVTPLRGILLVLGEVALFLILLAYFVLKNEGVTVPFGGLISFIALAGIIYLHLYNSKRRIRKTK